MRRCKQVECKGVGKVFYANNNQKNAGVTMLISGKNKLSQKLLQETKKGIIRYKRQSIKNM